jgi:Fe-S cluster assembly ATP-binding protein
MLEIQDLKVSVEDKVLIEGLNLNVKAGEVHAIMGPNGAAKSTLVKVLGGSEVYDVDEGRIVFNGENIVDLDPEDRAHKGLFISFQYPLEIAGISNEEFLYQAYLAKIRSKKGQEISQKEFKEKILLPHVYALKMDEGFLERDLNDGFSGGEKKRNEILQMRVLAPKLAVLDETDSGLDIDALRNVSEVINDFRSENTSVILITHYQRLLDYIKPDFVHVMKKGKIVRSGDRNLAKELEEKGYVTC